MGVVVSEISIDTMMAVDSVIANSRNRRPTMPAMRRIGIKTAISDMLMDKMVKPISFEPWNAAFIGGMPASRRRDMFSITTIASSTTKPVEIVNAISERLSMLKPNRYITAKVPMSETGTATVGMSVARQLRGKMKTTRITRMTERMRVLSTSLTEARMVVVRSTTIVVLMPCGMDASIDGNCAMTRSTVSMILAPGWRKIRTVMEGTPFRYPALRMFDCPSETSATSDSLTAAPDRK